MIKSAGILLFKKTKEAVQFLLVHPGGPFWAKKDIGAWSLPKGEFNENEEALNAAVREFEEETGTKLHGDFIELKPAKQKSGKLIYAWALENEFDVSTLKSNFFELEWPPKSGKRKSFPEIDKAQWFTKEEALEKIIPGQQAFIKELSNKLKE